MKKTRIWELDFIRGFAIVMVVIDHAMYDFAYMFSGWKTSSNAFLNSLQQIGYAYMNGPTRAFWRPSFLFLFFFVSGVCTAFSRDNLIRGLRLFAVAALLSVVTYFAQDLLRQNCFILLGVLHCLALITIGYAISDYIFRFFAFLTEKIARKRFSEHAKKIVFSVALLALSITFFIINKRYNVPIIEVFSSAKTIAYNNDWRGLFFYEDSWWTADYFPLFPYISFFFLGASVSYLLYRKKKSLFPALDGKWHYVFSYPGRYSLWIYLGGQVVVIGFCLLLDAILL